MYDLTPQVLDQYKNSLIAKIAAKVENFQSAPYNDSSRHFSSGFLAIWAFTSNISRRRSIYQAYSPFRESINLDLSYEELAC
jgi:hypothetical protein